MRAIVALLIVLAVAFVFVGTSTAATGGDVKASPLFKRSLEESIAKLEGKAPEAIAQGEAEPMPTGKPECPEPDQLPTEAGDTCYDSCSGTCFATCGGSFTCGGSTCGGSTCSSTCANTCSGPTCGSTCTGESCSNYCVEGKVKRDGQYASWSGWVNRYVVQLPLMQRWTTFSDIDGAYFLADIGGATQTLRADAHQTSTGFDYRGWRTLGTRTSPGTTHDFDINTTIIVDP